MKINTKTMFECWTCNKKHDGSLYDEWMKEKKVYYCDCGGMIISNSGKVMVSSIRFETKEDLEIEIDFLQSCLEEYQLAICKLEWEINSKRNHESYIKNKIYKINEIIKDLEDKNVTIADNKT